LDLAGSDTIEDLAIALIASGQCGTGLNYVDGGSGAGENALIAGSQQIAPMSRKVNATTNGTCNATGEGMFFALDAISIVVDSTQTERCGSAGHIHAPRGDAFSADGTVLVTKTTPSAPPSGTLSDMGADWGTKLLRLYGGNDGSGSAAACSSAERTALANNYKSLFPNNCGGTSGAANACTTIKHVYRRGDLSGTSDLFKTLVGAKAGVTFSAFCNGTDQQDHDPIRRACTADEQVCNTDHQLGLLLPINAPESGSVPELYNNQKCADGKFKFLGGPFNDSTCCFRRPNGTCAIAPVFLKCVAPLTAGNLPCLNGNTSDDFDVNIPVGVKIDNVAIDPRVYNLHVRDNTTTADIRAYRNGNDAISAFYRIHTSNAGLKHASTASPVDVCRLLNNTEEIGCLVQTPNSSCSLGYAGYAAVDGPQNAHAEPLALDQGTGPVDINLTTVQAFVVGGTSYPLTRKLYLNTFKGFQNVTGAESTLAGCFANITSAQLATSGFFPVPALAGNVGAPPVCESMCPQDNTVNGGHCAGNSAPFN
jgi:ABC-type phosphate transport system substrate-binding protein